VLVISSGQTTLQLVPVARATPKPVFTAVDQQEYKVVQLMRMTEEQVQEYLKSRGWPKRVWQGGREALIQRWKDFVADIEKEGETRNWLIDDYWIFLTTRELIHDISSDDRVADADNREGGVG
jgi:hypothetical protein